MTPPRFCDAIELLDVRVEFSLAEWLVTRIDAPFRVIRVQDIDVNFMIPLTVLQIIFVEELRDGVTTEAVQCGCFAAKFAARKVPLFQ